MATLLIVDDDSKIRSLIAKYAEFEGYSCEEADNGMTAVEKCREKHYDLVIMDVMMPELDGFSAVREIRKTDNVPVIMLSARGEEYDRIHGFEAGIDDYVVKPFSPRELMLRVAAVLKRRGPQEKDEEDTVTVVIGRQLPIGKRAADHRPAGGIRLIVQNVLNGSGKEAAVGVVQQNTECSGDFPWPGGLIHSGGGAKVGKIIIRLQKL